MPPAAAFGCAHAAALGGTRAAPHLASGRVRQQAFAQRRAAVRAAAADASPPPPPPLPTPLAPVASATWELDFYSRPVVGADGKKLWELVITDASSVFEHVEAIPNSLVNSRELRARIQAVIDEAPVKPVTVRFFRTQMLNMINIALSGIDVQARPSRRTYALFQLIRERERLVYPKMPGYRESLAKAPATFLGVDLSLSERLPDALRCEKFAFASLPLAQLEAFFEGADPSDFFGDSCLVDAEVPKDAMVPGLIVFSKRSKALAGWMSGLELAFLKAVLSKQELTLECGLTTRYLFAGIDETIKPEARAFQSAKEAVGGLHFLAVQKSEDTDDVDGFWLLTESQTLASG
jgi:RNA-binding protein Tab2/Atab2